MFENIRDKWIPEIQGHCPNAPFVIVGTMCEWDPEVYSLGAASTGFEGHRKYSPSSILECRSLGRQLAQQHEKGWKYLDCSLRSQEDTDRVFMEVCMPSPILWSRVH
jgi:cell division control protein 42